MNFELHLTTEQQQEQNTIYLLQVHFLELEQEQRENGNEKIADALAVARMAFLTEVR